MWISKLALILILALAAGCAGATQRDRPTEPDAARPALEDLSPSVTSFPSDSPTTVVGFGGGSLWTVDFGDYRCDDTPGVEASCHSPEKVSFKRLDPETLEVEANIPLEGADGADVAFGAGSAWIAYENYDSPSKSGVLRLDLDENKISHRIPMKRPTNVAFGDDSVWVTEFMGSMVSRIDPGTNEIVADIEVGGEASSVAVGAGAAWAASWPSREDLPPFSEEDYERGVFPSPVENAKLVRIDPNKNEVVDEIPVEATAVEGGASDVAVEENAVWVTSVNAKVLRVDPGTNETTARDDVGDYSFDVEVGEGDVWVQSDEENADSTDGYTVRLNRLDPASGKVTGRLYRENMSGLAVGGGAVWAGVADIESGKGGLVKLSP